MRPALTILTPTYNRAKYLPRIYDSLRAQTSNDFEWLIVDDGSTDETEKVVSEWLPDKNRSFELAYFKKPNGGKHTAINYATQHIKGPLVLILDSDDYLTNDAVESVLDAWKEYEQDDTVCGLSFLRGSDIDTPFARFDFDVLRSNHIDFRINQEVGGDCCEIIRTDILKEFPFPVYEGEKFVGEQYLWINVALKYDTIYINKIIYICKYLEGGLTKLGRSFRLKNPCGGMATSRLALSTKQICLRRRIRDAILYSCYGFTAGMPAGDIIKSSGAPFLVTLFLPAGRWFSRYWRR